MSSLNGADINASYIIDRCIQEQLSNLNNNSPEFNKTVSSLSKERDTQDKTAFFIVSNQLEQLKKLVEKK